MGHENKYYIIVHLLCTEFNQFYYVQEKLFHLCAL